MAGNLLFGMVDAILLGVITSFASDCDSEKRLPM